MIRKTPTVAALPGLADQSVKLQTLRPVHILSNIEHVGEFLYWYLQVAIAGCMWPQGSCIGGQEKKHFSLLEADLWCKIYIPLQRFCQLVGQCPKVDFSDCHYLYSEVSPSGGAKGEIEANLSSFCFSLADHDYEIVASIPLASICDVKKFSRKNMPKDKQMFLMDGFEVFCSNIQSYRVWSLMFELCCAVNFEVITHRITIWVSPLKLVLKISWVFDVLWMLVTLKSREAFSTVHTWSRWLAHIITILIVCLMQRLIGIIWPIGLWIVNYLNIWVFYCAEWECQELFCFVHV